MERNSVRKAKDTLMYFGKRYAPSRRDRDTGMKENWSRVAYLNPSVKLGMCDSLFARKAA